MSFTDAMDPVPSAENDGDVDCDDMDMDVDNLKGQKGVKRKWCAVAGCRNFKSIPEKNGDVTVFKFPGNLQR